MNDFQTIGVLFVAGIVAAGGLIAEHYTLMPYQLSRVQCYIAGSIACLVPLTVALWLITERPIVAVGVWLVWIVGGAATKAVYWWDAKISRRLESEAGGANQP